MMQASSVAVQGVQLPTSAVRGSPPINARRRSPDRAVFWTEGLPSFRDLETFGRKNDLGPKE